MKDDQGDTPRVLIADDHELFRGGLRELLEELGIRVVGEARDGEEALSLARRARPDVVVMDLNMPRLSGVEAAQRLAEDLPEVGVLMLTISESRDDLFAAVMAGARGYVLKDASIEEIAAAVDAVASGESLIASRLVGDLLARFRASGREELPGELELSDREVEVLRLLADGRDNIDIAEELVISPRTVKNHISSILAKLQVDNRIQAAVYAVRRGIV